MNRMWMRWSGAAAFITAGAVAGTALFALAQERPAVSDVPPAIEKRLDSLEKAVAAIQARMGRSSLPPTSANTLERRLDDGARRLEKLEKDLKRIEDKIRQLEATRR